MGSHRDYNAKRTDFGNTVRELSGRFHCWERLFHRRRLLRADDARADVRENSGIDRASSRFRKFSAGNNSPHDRAAGLSNPWLVDLAGAFYRAWNRFGGRVNLTHARTDWRLVSLVVVAANEVPVSLGVADSVRD